MEDLQKKIGASTKEIKQNHADIDELRTELARVRSDQQKVLALLEQISAAVWKIKKAKRTSPRSDDPMVE